MADTVGFITDLPKDLVNAFRATLEELREAELLLHVARCEQSAMAAPALTRWKRFCTSSTSIAPRGCCVFNKCDLVVPEAANEASALCVSAKTGAGLDALRAALSESLDSCVI